ncbi:lysoplasmalogenase [Formosa sp. PL04]|uniref:lysoplasmalogenase n=1 Tax=Formosa sp. PL04 TaxID=3081755 RepID=UPI002981CE96|nr:lysoplasmalogenase [Formosa sp. PL04]MDW5288213.1 lysoplasmalogenase [Formosa sp. PL04]
MLTKTDYKFVKIYLLVLVFELVFTNISSLSAIHYITKPALLVTLIMFFYKTSKSIDPFVKRFTLLGLIFSLIGDILLMFDNINSMFFTLGLSAFLIAHIMYILVFLKDRRAYKKGFFFLVALTLYGLIFLHFLKPNLGSLLTPVIIYVLAILGMTTTAFLRQKKGSETSYYLILIGALLFMLSDSLLAIHKFINPIPFEHILIMSTYGIAQLLLVLGIQKSS